MAVAPDQSLFVGWGVNDSGSFPLYDEEAYPMVRRLRDGQTTFDAVRTAGGGQDDKMMWTRFRPGPEGRVASYYCASDAGLFESPSVDCGEGYLGVGASSPLSPTGTNYVVDYDATKAMAASCDLATATMKVGPEGDTAAQKAVLFPCPQIIAVTVDAGGAPVVLVKSGSYLYVPRKR